jgi:hypothetical protein
MEDERQRVPSTSCKGAERKQWTVLMSCFYRLFCTATSRENGERNNKKGKLCKEYHCKDVSGGGGLVGLVWLLLYVHRHRSILGAAGHIIRTPANQLMEE